MAPSTSQLLVSIDRGNEHPVPVRLEVTASATVADLAAALDVDPARLVIDGRHHPPESRLHAEIIGPGSHVQVADPPDALAPSPGSPGPTVVVCGGLHAGIRHRLHGDAVVVGRAVDAPLRVPCPTVSPHHLTIGWNGREATVADRASTNGTRLCDRVEPDGRWCHEPTALEPGQVVQAGAARLRVETRPPDDRAALTPPQTGQHRFGFDRPPPGAEPAPHPSILAPAPPARPGGHSPFSWALFLCPLAVGLVLASLFSPLFAVFALLSPVMVVASWLENRRRERQGSRRESRRFQRALDDLADQLRVAARHGARELHDQHPDPGELVRRAATPSTALWARRPGHRSWLHLRVGTGARRWTPPVEHRTHEPPVPALDTVLAGHAKLADVPVTIDAGAASVIGLCGEPAVTRQVARALLVDAAVHHGPADLALMLDGPVEEAERRAPWSWLRWLPHHTVAPRGGGDADLDTLVGARHLLVVTERAGALRPDTWLRRRLDAAPDRTSVLVLADTRHALPTRTAAVVDVLDRDGNATVDGGVAGPTGAATLLDGVSTATAEGVARHMARLRDTEHVEAGAALPDEARLVEVARLEPVDADHILERWRRPPVGLATVIGQGTDGPCMVDLSADGPHALVAGTTGAGKSELLRTLVAGLAADHSPEDLAFVLVDYKGGSAFDACGDLPHTVGVVTDLDGTLGDRAVRSLEAELRYRERVLRAAGVSDLDAYRRAATPGDGTDHGPEPLPRLMVVVDEFAVLARELPTVLDALVDVAQRGRSLGVHLVLATQRPSGVINDQIRTNTNLRLCLRVLDTADSSDVVGTPEAARLPLRPPGRALLARGGTTTDLLQVARVSGRVPDTAPVTVHPEAPGGSGGPDQGLGDRGETASDSRGETAPGEVAEVTPGDSAGTPPGDASDADDDPTDLERLAAATVGAWGRMIDEQPGRPRRRVWIDPLPATVSSTEAVQAALGAPAPARGWVLGVADDPAHQCRRLVSWHPDEGPLAVLGIPGSGRTTTLHTLVRSMAADTTVAERHCWVVGDAEALGDLEHLDLVGAVVDPADTARVRRLTALLADPPPPGAPPRLLVVDGVRSLLQGVERATGMLEADAFADTLATRRGDLGVAVADRLGGIPSALAAASPRKLLLRLPDAHDYAMFGLPPVDPRGVGPGRGFDVASGLEVQIAVAPTGPVPTGAVPTGGVPTGGVPTVAAGTDGTVLTGAVSADATTSRPDPLAVLPRLVSAADVGSSQMTPEGTVRVTLGLADHPRQPAVVELAAGDHLLVTGPDGSGRSTTLTRVATSLAGQAGARVVVTGPARSALRDDDRLGDLWVDLADLAGALGFDEGAGAPALIGGDAVAVAADAAERPGDNGDVEAHRDAGNNRDDASPVPDDCQPVIVLLVDDADLVEDPDGVLRAALAHPHAIRVVAAAHPERLRSRYDHWARPLGMARAGLALVPDPADAALWATTFAAEPTTDWPPGRGLLVRHGRSGAVQVARP
jgi:DNA segregation ATPase FtsK/SpoIIIE, S-DNA-T family